MSSLWVGDLDPYMDETFVTRVFASLGENTVSVKSIKNKSTGGPAGYCFVDFGDAFVAERVLHKYNGTAIPGTSPVKKFKLNWAQYGKGDTAYQGPEYSLFVGDLTADVTDYMLQEFFQRRYATCRAAKVVLDNNGSSRGYGFVRFSDEVEQRRSMVEMQGATGCGGKPLRVSAATPKTRTQTSTISTVTQSYGGTGAAAAAAASNPNYYQQYQQYMNAWQQQQQYYQQYSQYGDQYQNYQTYQQQQQQVFEETITAEHTVEEPNEPLDVDSLNKELIQTYNDLYEEMEQSRWHPLESVTSAPKPVVV